MGMLPSSVDQSCATVPDVDWRKPLDPPNQPAGLGPLIIQSGMKGFYSSVPVKTISDCARNILSMGKKNKNCFGVVRLYLQNETCTTTETIFSSNSSNKIYVQKTSQLRLTGNFVRVCTRNTRPAVAPQVHPGSLWGEGKGHSCRGLLDVV